MTDSMFDRVLHRSSSRERREEQLDSLPRIMAGQALSQRELRFAGFFIATWFLMELVQWLEWLADKFR